MLTYRCRGVLLPQVYTAIRGVRALQLAALSEKEVEKYHKQCVDLDRINRGITDPDNLVLDRTTEMQDTLDRETNGVISREVPIRSGPGCPEPSAINAVVVAVPADGEIHIIQCPACQSRRQVQKMPD